GAVRSDETDPLAFGDRQIDVFERDKAAEALAEPADGEQRTICRLGDAHAACRCCTAASMIAARRRWRAEINPMIPFGAIMTKRIRRMPTINRLSAEEIVTVASCWIVPSRTAPMIGPTQLVMPPMTGIATLLTA